MPGDQGVDGPISPPLAGFNPAWFAQSPQDLQNQIRTYPEEIPTLLVALNRSKHPYRLSLLHQLGKTLLEEDLESDLWVRCITSELIDALVNTAMDASIYAMEGGTDLNYTHSVYNALFQCCGHIITEIYIEDGTSSNRGRSLARHAVDSMVDLWPFLRARCADMISQRQSLSHIPLMRKSLCESIIALMYCVFRTHTTCGFTSPPPMNKDMMHIVLYCWLHAWGSVCDDEALRLIHIGWFDSDGSHTQKSRWKRVMQETFAQGVKPIEITERIALALEARYNVDETLLATLQWFITTSEEYPAMVKITSNDESKKTIENLICVVAKAYRREICAGIPRYEAQVSSLCLEVWMSVISNATHGPDRFFTAVSNCTEDPKVVELVAHSLPVMIENDIYNWSTKMLAFLFLLGEMEKTAAQVVFSAQYPYVPKMRASMQRLYQPTLVKLQAMPALDRQAQALRRRVVATWTTAYRKLKIEENTPEEALFTDGNSVHDPAQSQCYNPACICHGTEQCHTMRVCKGCWQALYCNSKCQTGDWRRHRTFCKRAQKEDS